MNTLFKCVRSYEKLLSIYKINRLKTAAPKESALANPAHARRQNDFAKITVSGKRVGCNATDKIWKKNLLCKNSPVRAGFQGNHQIPHHADSVFKRSPKNRTRESALACCQCRMHRAFRKQGTAAQRFPANGLCLLQPDSAQVPALVKGTHANRLPLHKLLLITGQNLL
jgi:hypothetical protein